MSPQHGTPAPTWRTPRLTRFTTAGEAAGGFSEDVDEAGHAVYGFLSGG